jgi:dipeptidyl aminopeptidase/acylaminoacyl peptidase
MLTRLKALLLGSALAFGLAFTAAQTCAQEIPVETLFKRGEFRSLALSPDGKKLAAIAPSKGRYNLAVLDIEKRQLSRVTAFEDSDVNSYFWVNNDRLVFTTGDQQGFEFRGDGAVFAVNIDGSQARELNPSYRKQGDAGKVSFRFYAPLARVRGSEEDILVSTNERSADTDDVYRVNTRSGKKTLVTFDTPGNVVSWVLDANQVPRAAVVNIETELKRAFYYRADDKSPWQKIREWGLEDDEMTPEAFDKNGVLYVSSNIGRDTKALYEFDAAAKQLGKLVYGDDRYDITPPSEWGGLGSYGFLLFASEDDRQLVGVTYVADKPKTVWLDETRKNFQAQLDRALPNTVNTFSSLRDSKMLVSAASDRDPGTFYLFDSRAPSLTELVKPNEWIKPADMNEMRPITFSARDGMRIDGYITLPKSWKAGSPVPMIVHPHGGPWARDVWGFNPEVQFMANRGYAVLQVNFRNSTGYGKKLYRSGWKQWGDKSQDDILDGAMWAIKEGYADKDKIGVYGASYGGYSVLMQLVRSPELYKFGFNYVGVTDMLVHRDTQPAWFGGARKRLDILNGNPTENREMLERTSPARFVSRIKAPVMHAYGGADRNVNPENGRVIKSAFEKAGLPVDYTFVADEAHGYREDKNRFMLYNKFDQFMKTNLPTK